jgi:hypothetical protein
MIKTTFSKLFRWQPTQETLVALGTGVLVVGLSLAMIL